MSLRTAAISGSMLCCATTSSISPQCSTSGRCRVLASLVWQQHQQRGVMMYSNSLVRSQITKCSLGHGGRGGERQLCAGTPRDCRDRFAGEKLSKGRVRFMVFCKIGGGGSNMTVEDWTKKLPAKRKALYSHSLPCIEAWLHGLGFIQGKEDRAVWIIERPDWHAQLSLDLTDLHIRYLKRSPGSQERNIERKFSYALSREDLENAILGGP